MHLRLAVTAVGFSALAVVGASVAKAEQSPWDLALERPLYLQNATTQPETAEPPQTPPPAPPKPLEEQLEKAGVGSDKTGIQIYGFIEGSYTASFDKVPGNFITGRVFDVDNQEILLNQIDLTIEKAVDYGALAKDNKWGFGGKFESIYGADSRFIHSNGMNFYGGDSPQLSPENQFDFVQMYVDIAVPVGNGLLIRAGKMVTHVGYETINPTTNALYSHSYEFGFAIPFTHTGVMAFYNVNDKLTVMGGFSRGWEQSLEDNNGALDAMGQVKYVFNEKLTGYFNFVTGPEAPDNNSLWRTILDGIVVWTIDDHESVAADVDFGFEPEAAPNGKAAQWYGVALYNSYKINDYFTINSRGEWFSDPQGARGLSGNMYEVTFGTAVHPMPSDRYGQYLVIRPEIRWDYSDDGIFNGGTDNSQWTFGVDAIYTF